MTPSPDMAPALLAITARGTRHVLALVSVLRPALPLLHVAAVGIALVPAVCLRGIARLCMSPVTVVLCATWCRIRPSPKPPSIDGTGSGSDDGGAAKKARKD